MVMIELLFLLLSLFLLLPTFEKLRLGIIRVTILLLLSRIIVVAVIIAIADREGSSFFTVAAAIAALNPSHCQMCIVAQR